MTDKRKTTVDLHRRAALHFSDLQLSERAAYLGE